MWLADKLSGWASDDTKDRLAKRIEKLLEQAQNALNSLVDQINKLKNSISFPDKKPTVKWHSDDPERVEVVADWLDVLPKGLLKADGTPVSGTRWRVSWGQKQDDPNAREEITNDPRFTLTTLKMADLPYVLTICVKVKTLLPVDLKLMKLKEGLDALKDTRTSSFFTKELEEMKGKVFSGLDHVEATAWSDVGADTQTPFLRPPRTVLYGPARAASDAEDPSQGQVTVSGVSAPLWVRIGAAREDDLQLFNQEYTPPELPSTTTSGDAPLPVPVSLKVRLVAPARYHTTATASKTWVKHVSKSAERRDSAWVESTTSVPMVERVKTLDVSMSSLDIKASWATSTPSSSPLVYLVAKNNWYTIDSLNFQTSTGPQRVALLKAPEAIQHGSEVQIAVSDTRIPPGSIAIYKVYIDLASKKLFLSMTSSFEMRPGTTLSTKITPRYRSAISKGGSYQKSRFVVDGVNAPIFASVCIVARDDESKLEAESNSWSLAVPQSTLPRPIISAKAVGASVVVSWIDMVNVPKISIRISPEASWITVDRSKLFYEFPSDQLPTAVTPGAKYVISAFAVKGSAYGVASSLEYVVPALINLDANWSGPSDTSLNSLAANSGITVLQQRSDCSQHSLWATSATGQILYQHSESISWTTQAFDTALVTGSSMTAAYLSPTHQEIYWIANDGSIQARRRQIDPSDVQGTQALWMNVDDFPFATAKIASTANGGSISAVAHDGRIDLWWVNDSGALLKATFTPDPGKWTDASYLVYGEMGPSGDRPSKLAASSTDEVQTDMFWVTPSGRVHGERTFPGSLYGYIYGFWDEGVDAVNASPSSGPVALANASSTRLFWITPDGSVQTALQLRSASGHSAGGKNSWSISIISGHQSASISSELAAVFLNDQDLIVFWFAPDDTLVCARAVSTTAEKTAWQFVVKLPTVKASKTVLEGRKALRKTLAVATLGDKKIGVWYVDVDGNVKSLTWSG
ncbi:hypothetical protein OPT61_g6442 [Boeremia exigua]|uniref:Uncharacterized protein n=1 Tax=Boeremia exigua TaxID=749465 RepID=A0ACC2I6M5_9PLEO|nr:hypothetical protein OPT61_g6442 [Boeremia exigua]